MGEGDTIRTTEIKRRDKALSEGGMTNGSICAALGSTTGSGAHLKCFYTNTCNMRNKQDELEALVLFWSMISLVLVGLNGMCPMTGVLGWRAIGCYRRTGRAGEVDVLHLL